MSTVILAFAVMIGVVGKNFTDILLEDFRAEANRSVGTQYSFLEALYETYIEENTRDEEELKEMLKGQVTVAVEEIRDQEERGFLNLTTLEEVLEELTHEAGLLLGGDEKTIYLIFDQSGPLFAPETLGDLTGNYWDDWVLNGKPLTSVVVERLGMGNTGLFFEFESYDNGPGEPPVPYLLYMRYLPVPSGNGYYVGAMVSEINLLRILDRRFEDLKETLQSSISQKDGVTNQDGESFIRTSDGIFIAHSNLALVGVQARYSDPVTGQDLDKLIRETKEGPIRFYFNDPTEEGDAFLKIGEVAFFEPLGWYVVFTTFEDDLLGDIDAVQTILVLGGIIASGVAGVIIILTLRVVVANLKSAAEGLEDLSSGEGDLTRRLQVRGKDEVASLAKSFNLFVKKIQNIISEIKKVALSNQDIGEDLRNDTGNISSSMEEILANIQAIGTSSERLNENTTTTTEALVEINGAVKEVNAQILEEAAAVEESSASIEEMIASVANISRLTGERKDEVELLGTMASQSSEHMGTTMQDIEQIAASVDTIQGVVSVINGISSKINLLAMNAAIEAAHAGESGKGFAVVADEVRKLAESTGTNSKKISESIRIIINQITTTRVTSEETNRIIGIMEKTSQAVSSTMSEILGSITEVSEGNQQILEALSNLRSSSMAVKSSSAIVEEKAAQVTQSIEDISNLSNQNYQGVKEMQIAMDEIFNSVKHLSELGEDNNKNLAIINREVGNFKTEKSETEEVKEEDQAEEQPS